MSLLVIATQSSSKMMASGDKEWVYVTVKGVTFKVSAFRSSNKTSLLFEAEKEIVKIEREKIYRENNPESEI